MGAFFFFSRGGDAGSEHSEGEAGTDSVRLNDGLLLVAR